MALEEKVQRLREKELLSERASVNLRGDGEFERNTAHWSDYSAPKPGAVVNVATEEDIARTVKFAVANDIPFIAQNGGHGCDSKLGEVQGDGIMINLRGMNGVHVDLEKGTAVISAGASTGEVLEAASKAKAHVVVGVCNTVGAIGALLGGGLGSLIGLYGMGIDNFVSARLVTSTGEIINVSTQENSDLWWGIRGAGHNFGIVTQLTVKAHPEVNEGMHWTGMLVFPGEKLGKLVELFDGGLVKENMSCAMVWARVPPEFQPMVVLNLWFAGTAGAAKTAFASIYDLGPVMEQSAPTPYAKTNGPSDPFCAKGGRKMMFSVGMKGLKMANAVKAWEQWVEFTERNEDAKGSAVLVECYNYNKVREVEEMDTAFPWRSCGFHLLAVMIYSDAKLDTEVKAHGNKFREIMREGEEHNSMYVNFGNGDEKLEDVYGGAERLMRLKALKEKWDPEDHFSRYHPIR